MSADTAVDVFHYLMHGKQYKYLHNVYLVRRILYAYNPAKLDLVGLFQVRCCKLYLNQPCHDSFPEPSVALFLA